MTGFKGVKGICGPCIKRMCKDKSFDCEQGPVPEESNDWVCQECLDRDQYDKCQFSTKPLSKETKKAYADFVLVNGRGARRSKGGHSAAARHMREVEQLKQASTKLQAHLDTAVTQSQGQTAASSTVPEPQTAKPANKHRHPHVVPVVDPRPPTPPLSPSVDEMDEEPLSVASRKRRLLPAALPSHHSDQPSIASSEDEVSSPVKRRKLIQGLKQSCHEISDAEIPESAVSTATISNASSDAMSRSAEERSEIFTSNPVHYSGLNILFPAPAMFRRATVPSQLQNEVNSEDDTGSAGPSEMNLEDSASSESDETPEVSEPEIFPACPTKELRETSQKSIPSSSLHSGLSQPQMPLLEKSLNGTALPTMVTAISTSRPNQSATTNPNNHLHQSPKAAAKENRPPNTSSGSSPALAEKNPTKTLPASVTAIPDAKSLSIGVPARTASPFNYSKYPGSPLTTSADFHLELMMQASRVRTSRSGTASPAVSSEGPFEPGTAQPKALPINETSSSKDFKSSLTRPPEAQANSAKPLIPKAQSLAARRTSQAQQMTETARTANSLLTVAACPSGSPPLPKKPTLTSNQSKPVPPRPVEIEASSTKPSSPAQSTEIRTLPVKPHLAGVQLQPNPSPLSASPPTTSSMPTSFTIPALSQRPPEKQKTLARPQSIDNQAKAPASRLSEARSESAKPLQPHILPVLTPTSLHSSDASCKATPPASNAQPAISVKLPTAKSPKTSTSPHTSGSQRTPRPTALTPGATTSRSPTSTQATRQAFNVVGNSLGRPWTQADALTHGLNKFHEVKKQALGIGQLRRNSAGGFTTPRSTVLSPNVPPTAIFSTSSSSNTVQNSPPRQPDATRWSVDAQATSDKLRQPSSPSTMSNSANIEGLFVGSAKMSHAKNRNSRPLEPAIDAAKTRPPTGFQSDSFQTKRDPGRPRKSMVAIRDDMDAQLSLVPELNKEERAEVRPEKSAALNKPSAEASVPAELGSTKGVQAQALATARISPSTQLQPSPKQDRSAMPRSPFTSEPHLNPLSLSNAASKTAERQPNPLANITAFKIPPTTVGGSIMPMESSTHMADRRLPPPSQGSFDKMVSPINASSMSKFSSQGGVGFPTPPGTRTAPEQQPRAPVATMIEPSTVPAIAVPTPKEQFEDFIRYLASTRVRIGVANAPGCQHIRLEALKMTTDDFIRKVLAELDMLQTAGSCMSDSNPGRVVSEERLFTSYTSGPIARKPEDAVYLRPEKLRLTFPWMPETMRGRSLMLPLTSNGPEKDPDRIGVLYEMLEERYHHSLAQVRAQMATRAPQSAAAIAFALPKVPFQTIDVDILMGRVKIVGKAADKSSSSTAQATGGRDSPDSASNAGDDATQRLLKRWTNDKTCKEAS